jgi:hypothetical protein
LGSSTRIVIWTVSPGASGTEGVFVVGVCGDCCVELVLLVDVNVGFVTLAISTVFVVCFSVQAWATGVV